MMKHGSAISLLLALLVTGCAATRMPIVLDPSFAQRRIYTIAMLPVVDRRRDRSADIDLDHQLGNRAEKILKSKGYEVVKVSRAELSRDPYGPERIREMDHEYIASLSHPDANAVLVIYADDILSNYKVMVYQFKIEATGTLVSKSDGKELWRDKGIGNSGQAGLISGLTQLWNRSMALDRCVNGMLSTLPKLAAGGAAMRDSAASRSVARKREAAIQDAVQAASSP